MRPNILIVDDDVTLANMLQEVLADKGHGVKVSNNAHDALRIVESDHIGLALVDLVLPELGGLEVLSRIKTMAPDIEVVMMTAHASVESAVQAIQKGAFYYLQKPFEDIDEVWITVQRALERRQLSIRNRSLLQEQEERNRELSAAVTRLSSLIDAGRAMSEYHTLPELLDFFINLVAEELKVSRASLMLLDPKEGVLRIAASQGMSGVDIANVQVKLGEGIAGIVAKTGEPYLVTDTAGDPAFKVNYPHLSESFISAPVVLSIPIKYREKVLGVINVTNRQSGTPLGKEDLRYLTGLAGQVAVAIDRAKHFEDLEAAYQSLKAAQEQLVFSERLKAIGQMAAGVAHDFNNALSIILGKTQLALHQMEKGNFNVEKIKSDLTTIEKVSLQGAEAIKRVQEFTRIRKDLPHSAVNLNTVIRDSLEMTRPKWKAECDAQGRLIDIKLDLAETALVAGNIYELTQVVGNLIFNAVEAMPEGGTLTFKTLNEAGRVLLEVTDTGEGMDEEACERLFEPFYTTKNTGQGLGTSIIYGIIGRHGGEITVSSHQGEGTTFRVMLPRFWKEDGSDIETKKEEQEVIRSARILLVEDDKLVMETYREALTAGGHDVVTAETGRQALSLLDKMKFDLIITDLSMPGITGFEVAKGVKRVAPEIPVVLLSGLSVQQKENRVQEAGIDFVLAKPCVLTDLLQTVRDALMTSSRVPA
jgi:signal transduction histidine kinase/DNA-binding response OmpR family regulator